MKTKITLAMIIIGFILFSAVAAYKKPKTESSIRDVKLPQIKNLLVRAALLLGCWFLRHGLISFRVEVVGV